MLELAIREFHHQVLAANMIVVSLDKDDLATKWVLSPAALRYAIVLVAKLAGDFVAGSQVCKYHLKIGIPLCGHVFFPRQSRQRLVLLEQPGDSGS